MAEKVVILVDSTRYEVSKKKLAQKSNYFNSMFNGGFLEKNENTINIQGIDRDAWEEILNYVEVGKIRPKPFSSTLHKGILKLFVTSDMLLFQDVRDLCLKSLVEILTPENSLEILEVSNNLGIEGLMQKARAVTLWYADIIIFTEAFYNLNVDQVVGYLSEPGLHGSYGEWGIWDAINRWIASDPEPEKTRHKYLPRLIKCLSLTYLSSFNLRTISLNEGVRSNPIVSAAVKGLLDNDVTDPEVDEFISSWRSLPQRHLPMAPAVVARISVSCCSPSPYIVRFNLDERKFVPFLRLDQVEKNLNSLVGFKVIAAGSKLFMMGGEVMNRQVSWYLAVWEYDQILERWNFLTNLRKETRHPAACVLGTDLYVIGGFGRDRIIQDNVSKFSLIERKWTTCSPLLRPMYAVPCCAFRGKIYAVKTEIHEYDPMLDMWEALDIDLPPGDVFCVAMTDHDYIFIMGLRKIVYKFDPTSRDADLVEVGRFLNDCNQGCIVDDYIYNVSQSNLGNHLTCERIYIPSGVRETVWKGNAGDEIDTFSPNHHHGCFPLLMY